jgi:tight adherence protein B
MCDEIRRVVHEVQLGRPLPDSLQAMADRVGCDDFGWVVQAIEINAEVGGDLVEVLDAVASTIRARAHLRRQIRTLSAQGRLSARILLAMPFFMAGLLSLIHPGYLSPLIEASAGPFILGIGAALMIVGWLWLRRIVRLQF